MEKIVSEYPVWFNPENFQQYLSHYKGQQDLKFLQIGVFTGDASVWLLENILTDSSSLLIDVDTWQGSPDEDVHMQMDFEDVYKTYKNKMEPYNNMRSIRDTSSNFFEQKQPDTYDFIYIDGDHTEQTVYADGVNAWNCLKPNGILAFDDYTWGDGLEDQSRAPRPAIDRILEQYTSQYTLLIKNYQVWIRKNA